MSEWCDGKAAGKEAVARTFDADAAEAGAQGAKTAEVEEALPAPLGRWLPLPTPPLACFCC